MIEKYNIKKLKIIRITEETKGAKTFELKPLENWQPDYKTGQFITLVFYTKHGEKRRSYSFSSSPLLDEAMCITVKKVDNGEFSRFMLQHLKVGDVLYSSGIGGQFTLPESNSPVSEFCFLAAGSGIVPCYALIKSLLVNKKNKVTLIYSNKNNEETIFYQALQKLQVENKTRFTIRFLFNTHNNILHKRLSKWLLEQLVDEYLEKDLTQTFFYVCGPFEYMQTIEITLRSKTPKENIIKENFSSLPRLLIPEPLDKQAHVVKIHIEGKVHSITVQYPKSILAVAKQNNISLPYSCEAGRCSSCVATCTKGKIWMAYNEVLVDREVEKGRVLVCQGFPIGGDAEIVYEVN